MSKSKKKTKTLDSLHVGAAIEKTLTAYGLRSRFEEFDLISSWEELAGRPIARQTKRVSMNNKTLFVELRSSSARQNVHFLKDDLLEKITARFGPHTVQKIVLLAWWPVLFFVPCWAVG